MSSFAGKSKAPARTHIPASPLRHQRRTGRRREAAEPIMSHSSYFSFRRPSPSSHPSFFSPLLVSPSVLRLRRKCAVSSCTSSVLSSLHVNKHPKYIIGTEPHVHAAQRTADGHVTPDKPHQGDTDVPSTFLNYCQLQPPPCTHRRRCGSKHGQ